MLGPLLPTLLHWWGKTGRGQGVAGSRRLHRACPALWVDWGGLPCLFKRKNTLIKNGNPLPENLFKKNFQTASYFHPFYDMKLTLPLSIWEYSHDIDWIPKPEADRMLTSRSYSRAGRGRKHVVIGVIQVREENIVSSLCIIATYLCLVPSAVTMQKVAQCQMVKRGNVLYMFGATWKDV